MPQHHRRHRAGLIALISLLLAGCGASSRAVEEPAIRLAGDDVLSPIAEMIANAYEEGHPGSTISYQAMPLPLIEESLAKGSLDAAITSEPLGEDNFSTAVGSVTWVVTINSSNPTTVITRDDLQALMEGSQTTLGSDGCDLVVIGFPEGYAGYEVMKSLIPLRRPPASTTRLVMDGQEAIGLLVGEPCGIAILPDFYGAAGTSQVQTLVTLGGNTRDYSMNSPVYFIAGSEPETDARELLRWILSEEGQAVIAALISPLR